MLVHQRETQNWDRVCLYDLHCETLYSIMTKLNDVSLQITVYCISTGLTCTKVGGAEGVIPSKNKIYQQKVQLK